MQEAVTGFLAENYFLLRNGVDENFLSALSDSQFFVQGRMMMIAAPQKFPDQGLVPFKKRLLFADPSERFRMAGISAFSAVLGQNIPKTMKFPVFRQKVFPAKMFWMYVPNPHN